MEDAASAGKQQPAAGAAPGAQAAPAGGGAAGGAANPQQAAPAEGGTPQNGSGRPQVPFPLYVPVRRWTIAWSFVVQKFRWVSGVRQKPLALLRLCCWLTSTANSKFCQHTELQSHSSLPVRSDLIGCAQLILSSQLERASLVNKRKGHRRWLMRDVMMAVVRTAGRQGQGRPGRAGVGAGGRRSGPAPLPAPQGAAGVLAALFT